MPFKKIVLLFCLLIFSSSYFILHSQTRLNLHLNDLQKRPISFAVVKWEGLTFISNASGICRINNYKAGSRINIYKLGFADTTVSLNTPAKFPDSLDLFVVLRLRPTVLPEVAVNSGRVEEINPAKADFVLGYELKGNYLVELLSDDNLLLMDVENKIKFRSRSVDKAKEIVKDAEGNIHILTDKTAFRIFPDSSSIQVDTTHVDLVKLKWNLQYCDEVTEKSRYIRRYKDNNQTVAFFAMSKVNSNQVRMIKEISDAQRRSVVVAYANETYAFNQYVESLGLSEVTATSQGELELVRKAQRMVNMLDMAYALPAYSFLKLVNDSIYLFAHDLDSMFVYDQNWNLAKSKRIDYHHLKKWGKELFVNEERTKVYAKLLDDSKTLLAEIDLQSGALKPTSTKLEASFPTRIKIRNDVAYFMSKQKKGPGYTVYAQSLR